MIDTIIGRHYRIVKLLGRGGMGAVYEAEHTLNKMRVAVKVITAEGTQSPTLVTRFEREARATIAIDTPHIVRVLDAGGDEATGVPYLAMEHLEGEDLAQLIRRLGPLPPDLALRVVAQACLGLHRAHEARIIHRDIKPANLFLAKGGAGERIVKLLDFGVAKITPDPTSARAETAGLTRSGSMLGSPLYMSPEQARGHKEIDRRSDVWSMGIVLYQALTGRTPHHDSDALGELIIAICTEPPEPIQEIAPWVPPEIAAVAHGALRFNPKERYQTAAEMLDAIRPLLPRGWVIDESMLVPLAEEDRERVAPRLLTQPDAPPQRSRAGTTQDVPAARPAGPSAVSESSTLVLDEVPAPVEPVAARTAENVSVTQASSIEGTTVAQEVAAAARPAPAPAASGRVAILAGVLLAVAAGALVLYEIMPRVPSKQAAPTASPSAPSASPAPQPSAPVAPVAPADARRHTVNLVILPEGATVEVDGAPAAVKDGVVAISGPLGSVHEVRVSMAGEETQGNVVVSESGAVPPKIHLELKAPKTGPGVVPSVRGPTPRQHLPDLRDQR